MKLHLSKMCSGWKHSELAKEKISNKLKGVPKPPITEKTRMKMKMSQQKRWSLKTN